MARAAASGLPDESSYPYSAFYASGNYYTKYPGICSNSKTVRLPANTKTYLFLFLFEF
jgi:hypothetical protein